MIASATSSKATATGREVLPFLIREVTGLRAACSSLANWKRTPLFLSNTYGLTSERQWSGALMVRAAFLIRPGAWNSKRERMAEPSCLREDIHEWLYLPDNEGEIW